MKMTAINLYEIYLAQSRQEKPEIKCSHMNEHDNSVCHPNYHNNTHDNTPDRMMIRKFIKNEAN